MGMRTGYLSVKSCINLWESLGRSILEFSSAVWGGGVWRDAEILQRNMCKKILRCSVMTTNEAVLGDLGFWTLRARFDLIILKYWFHLISLPDSRLLKQAYLMSRNFSSKKKRNWANRCKTLLFKYNLRHLWYEEQLVYNLDGNHNNEAKSMDQHERFFGNYVTKVIHKYEENQWRERMENISKLRTYRCIKQNLSFENYLNISNCKGRALMFSIRSGTNKLEIERGRWIHKPEMHRICKYCSMNQVENEIHFTSICPKYQDLREQLYHKIFILSGGKWNLDNLPYVQDKFSLLVKGTRDKFDFEIFRLFQSFLLKAYKRREVEVV